MPATEDPVIWFYLGMNREKKRYPSLSHTVFDIWLDTGYMAVCGMYGREPDNRPNTG